MKLKIQVALLLFVGMLAAVSSCRHEVPTPAATDHGFPDEVGKIFINRCATAGCHNAASHQNSGGLLLDSWEHLFEGGNNGAVIVPFSVDYSPLLYFINTDSALGPVAVPTMPLNSTPLSKEEYLIIRNWVASGAPDREGNVPFASSPQTRQKIYAVHRGCDMVAVIDAEKNLVMRYIAVGEFAYPEAPTYIQVSPDGRYAWVGFWYNRKIYRIDTNTDEVVGSPDLGENFWYVLHFTPDGEKILVTNGDNNNLISVNPLTQEVQQLTTGTEFSTPFGIASNATSDTFYVTGAFGNTVYKYATGYNKKISIDGKPLTSMSAPGTPDPYQIIMSPDYSKYFISCANTNEVRVMDAKTDSLLKVIPVGIQPANFAISKVKPYLFVSCVEDNVSLPGMRGSVYVLDYNNLTVVKKLEGKLFQPNGITVNDKDNTLYVFSRNQNFDGPAPHHQGPCTGRNGFYSVYDLNTLAPVTGRRYEVLVDPIVSDVRFK